jgi:Protein of unknown function (DUF2855)
LPHDFFAADGRMTGSCRFLVDRKDLGRIFWEDEARALDELAPGYVRILHKRFALTSNNITYALLGEAMGYWYYFPVPEPWGSIPVWGIGEVTQSRHNEIAEGENIYGYFPMSTELVVQPDRVKATGFADAIAHRAALPQTYNEYVRIDHDPSYDEDIADAHLVLWPLFSLSFFLAHFLSDAAFFGAKDVIISSASSKTAMGLAFQLRRLCPQQIRIIGMTGAANIAFVAASQLYDQTLAYADAKSLADLEPALYVDIAGNDTVRAEVHRILKDRLRYSCSVGLAHAALHEPGAASALPGPEPEFFFTPKHILARRESWGPAELRRRLAIEWQAFIAHARERLRIEHASGPAAIEHVYVQVLRGLRPPDRADILSF